MKNLISKNDNILISGGSGFLGLELLKVLSKKYKNITIFGRDEGKLILAKQEFPHVKIITGDVISLSHPYKRSEYWRFFFVVPAGFLLYHLRRKGIHYL